MGWRNRLISLTDDLKVAATNARYLVSDAAAKHDGSGVAQYEVDRLILHLLNGQQAIVSALGELYESCGPFVPNRNPVVPRDPTTMKCEDCGDHFVPNSDPPKCPNCGTTHPARGEKT